MIRIQNVSEVPDTVIKQGEKIKGIQTGKEEVKSPLLVNDENIKDTTRENQNKFRGVAEYRA